MRRVIRRQCATPQIGSHTVLVRYKAKRSSPPAAKDGDKTKNNETAAIYPHLDLIILIHCPLQTKQESIAIIISLLPPSREEDEQN